MHNALRNKKKGREKKHVAILFSRSVRKPRVAKIILCKNETDTLTVVTIYIYIEFLATLLRVQYGRDGRRMFSGAGT